MFSEHHVIVSKTNPFTRANHVCYFFAMPEGPEVRTQATGLDTLLKGKILFAIRKHCLNDTSKEETRVDERRLAGANQFRSLDLQSIGYPCRIERVYSHGKRIIFVLSNGKYLYISLRMTGRFQLTAPSKPAHLKLTFRIKVDAESATGNPFDLYYVDKRGLGTLDVIDGPALVSELKTLGPDLLSDTISCEQWRTILRSRNRMAIGAALLNQSIVAGIGTYLASEILSQANIHPRTKISTIDDDKLERLRYVSHMIIRQSFEQGGFTMSDYFALDGNPGRFRPRAYGQKTAVEKVSVGGRTVYFAALS